LPSEKPAVADRIPTTFNLTGRVAVLTGGAGLLGRQYTRTLLGAGARVVVADLNAQRANEAAAAATDERGGEAIGWKVDVRSKDDVQKMVDGVGDRFGRLDILINNAAIDPKLDTDVAARLSNTFEDYPLDLWQQSLDVNLTGAFLCCQAAGKVMLEQKRGVIVNICSTYGLVAPDQRLYRGEDEPEQTLFKPASYCVTKAGIAHLTRYLAAYWGGRGIRVNTLTPGGVFSAQDDQFVARYSARTPLGRMADASDMNGAMLFLVSDASSYMNGANLVVDGGWTAW
jgi:NAD(P)-dependent dehydrogenase (short-subunit alcohol dehydrogenase family)